MDTLLVTVGVLLVAFLVVILVKSFWDWAYQSGHNAGMREALDLNAKMDEHDKKLVSALPDHWRTHAGQRRGVFDVCTEDACPEEHFMSSFGGTHPIFERGDDDAN